MLEPIEPVAPNKVTAGIGQLFTGLGSVAVLRFQPDRKVTRVGQAVTWTNHDDIPHTVVSTDKAFKSKVLDTDEKFSFTFSTAGTYPYFCSIHPKMTGKVVVR